MQQQQFIILTVLEIRGLKLVSVVQNHVFVRVAFLLKESSLPFPAFFFQHNCFTVLCQLLLYNKVSQLYVYIYPLPLGLPSRSPSHLQSTKPSSLCYAAASHQLSVLHIVALVVKNLPANVGDIRDVGSVPGLGRCPGGGHKNHSTVLAWRIPWTEEPGGLWSTGSQSVSIYMSVLFSQFTPPLPFPLCVRTSVLHICVSIPALQTGSSTPAFQISYICFNLQYLFFSF